LGSETLFSKIIARITPYIAVASQKMTLTRFLDLILGALTAAPTKLDQVNHIPHAAPTTENPKPIAMPQLAHE
jgi:hypothetical protein